MIIDIEPHRYDSVRLQGYKLAKGAEGPTHAGAKLSVFVSTPSALSSSSTIRRTWREWDEKSARDRKVLLNALHRRCMQLAVSADTEPQILASYAYEDGGEHNWAISDRRTLNPSIGAIRVVYHRSMARRMCGMRGLLSVELGWFNAEAHEIHWRQVDLMRPCRTPEDFRIPLPTGARCKADDVAQIRGLKAVTCYTKLPRPWSWRAEPVDVLAAALWAVHLTGVYMNECGGPTTNFAPEADPDADGDTNTSSL